MNPTDPQSTTPPDLDNGVHDLAIAFGLISQLGEMASQLKSALENNATDETEAVQDIPL